MLQIRSEDNFVCPCIVCGKEILPQFDGHSGMNEPKDATFFKTYGNYGSGHFDSFGEALLEINVCDDCMGKAIASGKAMLRATNPSADSSLEKGACYVWDGSRYY
jgi:hypothetical protein